LEEPTLQIVRENGVAKIYVDGLSQEDYCRVSGLRLPPEVKGQYVMGKRLSRIMRPHYIANGFDPDDVRVAYLEPADYAAFIAADPGSGAKVWDGAGLVSRRMLEKMAIPEGTPPDKSRRVAAL
jgi:hypothetical protein